MRQLILTALKAKYTGVSEAILGRIADKLAKTITKEEEVATAVEGVTMQQVLESYGDSRATEAQATAIKNYENKYNLKDGKIIEPAGGADLKPQGGNDDVPGWAKTLLDTNKKLTERLNKMEAERTTTSRRQQLDAIIGKLPENLRKAYQRTSVENLKEEEFATMLSEVTTEVEGIEADMRSKGAVFGRPTAQGGGTPNKEQLTEDQIKAITTRTSVAGDGQQPF